MCHSIVGFLCSIQFNIYDLVVIYYSITFLCVTCFFLFFSLIGLSSYCAELNYVRPELTDSDELDIRGGRYDVNYRDFFNPCLLVSRLLFKISISET